MSRCRIFCGAVTALGLLLSAAPAALADSSPLVTNHPDLIGAEALSATQVLACFDQILASSSLTDTNFYLQGYPEATRTGVPGGLRVSSAMPAAGGVCVVAAFTGAGDARSFSRLAVLAGAVNAAVPGGPGATNVQDSTPLVLGTNPGPTSGPDLTSFQINRGSGIVSFVFDQPVSTAVAAIIPARFHLVDKSANLSVPPPQTVCPLPLGATPAPQFTVGPANTVNVNFAVPTCQLLNLLPGPPELSAVRSAVGVSVDEGAASDALTAVSSPLVSLGVTPNASGPTGPSTPPGAPVPPLPAPGAQTQTAPKPKATPKACRRVVTLHLTSLLSGKLISAKATINGKKLKVSKHLTVTIDFGQYPGVKSLVVKLKGKLKHHRSVSATKTYKNKC